MEALNLRKAIDKLQKQESDLYFFCVRLLHIFDKPQDSNVFQFIYEYNSNKQDKQNLTVDVSPKCMYDNLISFHASCCEHGIQFFPYWHRWLMSKFQSYLLQSHQIITNDDLLKKQADRLSILANKDVTELLKKIQNDYKDIIKNQVITYIPGHYWNVFAANQKINYPDGFYRGTNQIDPKFNNIDMLIKLVWEQNSIFQINFQTRFNAKLHQDPVQKPDNYQEYLKLFDPNGYKSVWTNPQPGNALNVAKEFIQKDQNKQIRQRKFFYYRQYLKRKNSGNPSILIFNVYQPEQINYVFGGQDYQYFKDTNDNDENVRIFKKERNDLICYYTYCRSLKTHPQDFIKMFCTTSNRSSNFSMQNPHNQMHNDQSYIMSHASYSITNPIFFAYHSFIDLMLQFNINKINKNQNDLKAAVQNAEFFFNQDLQAKGYDWNFIGKWIDFFKSQNSQKNPLNKDYPILKWIKNRNQNNNLNTDDFKTVENKTYKQLILGNQRLCNLNDFLSIGYDQNSSFTDKINDTFPNVPDPYSNIGLYVALLIRYKSTIHSTNLIAQINNNLGKFLALNVFPIFSRQGAAVNCPNCSLYKYNILLFKIEEFGSIFGNKVQSKLNPYSCLSYHLNHPQVTAKYFSGRVTVRVKVVNIKDTAEINLKVKQRYPQDEQKKLQKLQTFKPFILNKQKKSITFDSNNIFYITSINVQSGGKIINYKFCFFREHCEVQFDFSKDQKSYELSENSTFQQFVYNKAQKNSQPPHPKQTIKLQYKDFKEIK